MLIQMLDTHYGTTDGFTVLRYKKGEFLQVHEQIGHTLAASFLHKGWARLVDEKVVDALIASPYLNAAFS